MDLNTLQQFLPLILIFVIMYFFMIRPQQKKTKAANLMRNNMKRGDKVTTNGGIIGKVVKIKDDVVTIETGKDRVQIEIIKAALTVTQAAPGSAAPSSALKEKQQETPVYQDEEEYSEYVEDARDGDYEEYDLDDSTDQNKKK